MPIENQHLDRSKFEIWTPKGTGQIAQSHDVDEDILRAYQDHMIREDYIQTGMPGLSLGSVPNPEEFSHYDPTDWTFKITTMMIKEAGSNQYSLPAECKRFHETIKSFAEDQHARSPLAEFKYCTMTARYYYVQEGRPQVFDEWHIDDAKEADRIIRKSKDFPISHDLSVQIYSASDHTGTRMQSQRVTDAKRVFNDRADVRDREIQRQFTQVAAPYERTLINNYTNHQPGRVATSGLRGFIALVYSPTKPMEDMLGRISQPLVFKSSLTF